MSCELDRCQHETIQRYGRKSQHFEETVIEEQRCKHCGATVGIEYKKVFGQ